MKVKFWGVRGSIPVSSSRNSKYGGNTSCVEVTCDDKTIILDCGTGARALGLDILERDIVKHNNKNTLYMFFSHFHWDHIQGFPFFRVAFHPEYELNMYSSLYNDKDIESALSGQMTAPYFPIQLGDMPAKMNFNVINSDEIVQIGKIDIKSISLNHPGGSRGFKIICDNRSIAYISDHEHTEESRREVVDFLKNTNLVMFDSHYTPEEYLGLDGDGGRKGWGHSTWKDAVTLCSEAGIDQLILTHHGHEDEKLDRIELEAQKVFRNTVAAYEGLEIDLR